MRTLIMKVGLVVWVVSAVVCAAPAALAQEQKHSDPSRSCVSSECHAPVVKHKYLHGPLQVGQCTVCHAPLPGSDHKFKLVETEAKLCLTCHKRVDTPGINTARPGGKGKVPCVPRPARLGRTFPVRKSPAVKLCNECHNKKPVLTRKYAHKPVAHGECLSCHRPHATKEKNLLDASGSKLCLQQVPRENASGYGCGEGTKNSFGSRRLYQVSQFPRFQLSSAADQAPG